MVAFASMRLRLPTSLPDITTMVGRRASRMAECNSSRMRAVSSSGSVRSDSGDMVGTGLATRGLLDPEFDGDCSSGIAASVPYTALGRSQHAFLTFCSGCSVSAVAMSSNLFVRGASSTHQNWNISEIRQFVSEKTPFWLDADGDDPTFREALSVLGLHSLAIEDIFQERVTPKVEDYGDYLYVVIHGISYQYDTPEDLRTVEFDLVISENWVISHHRGQKEATDEVCADLRRNPKLLDKGPAFVAHAIMDHVVDDYTPAIDAFDVQIDAIETNVVENPNPVMLQQIFRLKRSLQRLRRIAMHQREVLLRISRGEFEQIPERVLPFFRDIHDHFVRVSDMADGYRELLNSALDAYHSAISNRMNEVMKTLTLVSTIMLPLSFIAGLYGMNFEHMPELHWHYGYFFAVGLMLMVATAMVMWFRHKRWL
jgi:magnesium transporter